MKNVYILFFAVLVFMVVSCQKGIRENEASFETPLTGAEMAKGILTPEIMWKFGRLGEVLLLPDSRIVYTVTRYNLAANKGNGEIFIQENPASSPKRLTNTSETEFNLAYNPVTNKLLFISYASGEGQIWEMNTDGTMLRRISSVEKGINAFGLSPDGKKLFYIQDVKLEKDAHDLYPDMPLSNLRIDTALMYRHWNDWSDYQYSHIFIADFVNGQVPAGKDIMEGELWDAPLSPGFDVNEIKWSPDGNLLAYTCKKLHGRQAAISTNSDIYLYDLKTGKTINFTGGMPGYDRNPVFSPNGKYLAWLSMETPGYESDKNRLLMAEIATGIKKDVSAQWDQNADDMKWFADSVIYLVSGIKGTQQVYKVNPFTSHFTQITSGKHDYTSVYKTGLCLAGTKMSMSQASEIYLIDENTGNETQFTFINKNIYEHIKTGRVEERWITTTDGKQMLTWVIYPPAFDAAKKYPALLYCQGGPQSTVSQFWSYRWNFQLMAANGYIVIAPNRRGVPSFGKEWNDQIAGDYSGQNICDYFSSVDALKKEPFIDAEKIGAVGASYGGYSVFYMAGHHQKRFKAFIAHCGMYNLESFMGATEESFFSMHDLGGAYWETANKTAQRSYANSPHKFVQNWDTPILIITGGKDFRIPYTESLQAFNAAQLRGIPSKLLFFPEETHFVLKPQNAVVWNREFFAWLDQYLK